MRRRLQGAGEGDAEAIARICKVELQFLLSFWKAAAEPDIGEGEGAVLSTECSLS